jgi:hypothetical protein
LFRSHYEGFLFQQPITTEVIMAFSITEYLEDLLLATDSEQNHDEDDYNFEVPEFVREQVVL